MQNWKKFKIKKVLKIIIQIHQKLLSSSNSKFKFNPILLLADVKYY